MLHITELGCVLGIYLYVDKVYRSASKISAYELQRQQQIFILYWFLTHKYFSIELFLRHFTTIYRLKSINCMRLRAFYINDKPIYLHIILIMITVHSIKWCLPRSGYYLDTSDGRFSASQSSKGSCCDFSSEGT